MGDKHSMMGFVFDLLTMGHLTWTKVGCIHALNRYTKSTKSRNISDSWSI